MPENNPNDASAVCPESTIDSANRRNFIKKAALATAAIGVAGVFLGDGKIIPESSAASTDVTTPIKQGARNIALWGDGFCPCTDNKCYACAPSSTCINSYLPQGGAFLQGCPVNRFNCPATPVR